MDSSVTQSLVTEVRFIMGTSNSWCLDSGTTNHICNKLQKFQKIKKLSDGEITLFLSLKARVAEVSGGVVKLLFSE